MANNKKPLTDAVEAGIQTPQQQSVPGADALAFIQQYCQDKLVKEDKSIQMVMAQQLTAAFNDIANVLKGEG